MPAVSTPSLSPTRAAWGRRDTARGSRPTCLSTPMMWVGSIPLTSPTWLIVQAVDNAGNIARNDNGGRYYLYVANVVAPNTSLTSGQPTLRWPHLGDQIARYEVWRSATPYFAPGDAGTPVSQRSCCLSAQSFHGQIVRPSFNPGTTYFYLVRQSISTYGQPPCRGERGAHVWIEAGKLAGPARPWAPTGKAGRRRGKDRR